MTANPFPGTGSLLGVDFGLKRVGLAVSSPEQTIAMPLGMRPVVPRRDDSGWYRELVDAYRIVGLVVGLPLHVVSGEESDSSGVAREFGRWLAATVDRPLRFWDERYSSAEAELHLMESGRWQPSKRQQRKSRGDIDSHAAQVILHTFLQSHDRDRWGD